MNIVSCSKCWVETVEIVDVFVHVLQLILFQGGDVYVPEGPLSVKSVQAMFQMFAEKTYTPFLATLQCGNFKCPVQLHPRPEAYDRLVHLVISACPMQYYR
jgi:hypothetical protein